MEALEKYNKKIEVLSYKFIIVIPNEGKSYTFEEYIKILEEHKKDDANKSYVKSKNDKDIKNFINKLANIDINNLKVKDVYVMLEEIKKEAQDIKFG